MRQADGLPPGRHLAGPEDKEAPTMPVPHERKQAKKKHDAEGPHLEAQPKPISEQARGDALPEVGLSADPDQLGTMFLRDATEQGNMESWRGDGMPSLDLSEGPPSDEAMSEPSFDPDESVWEATADLTLQSGPLGAPVEELDDQPVEPAEAEEPVDVVEDSIHEATLLDHEGDELGEVETGTPETDDTNKHRYLRRPRPRPH
jgi:hypothetical protein